MHALRRLIAILLLASIVAPAQAQYTPIPNFVGPSAGAQFRAAINNAFGGLAPITPQIAGGSIINTALMLQTWTTAGRPTSPQLGQTGINVQTNQIEVFYSGGWQNALPLSGLGSLASLNAGANLTVGGGALSLNAGNVVAALGFTPLNKAGDTLVGTLLVQGALSTNGTTTLSNGGLWSSFNFGKQLLITTPPGFSSPAIGITDSNGTNLWAIANGLGTLNFATMPAYSNSTTAPNVVMTLAATGATIKGTVNATSLPVNVLSCGADPTGVADSAPAFRACTTSNRKVTVPQGTYLFASAQAAPCCAFNAPAVLVQGQSNFDIEGDGATITIANGIALSSAFHFDRDSHFTVRGLTIQGNRTGLTSGQENAGLTLSSDTDFRVEDVHFSGNFGGGGAAIDGDWLVNGTFTGIQMDAVAHCYDMAYLYRVGFWNTHARGADSNGASGAGQIGQTCLSVIVDTPNAAQNNTGTSFTETDGVTVSGVEEANFSTGALIETGTHYVFSGNYWHDNPGLGGAAGLGMWIHYNPISSIGVPPTGISVSDRFANNGAVVPGVGLLLGASGITNSDTLANIYIGVSQFDNNNSIGVGADTPLHFSNLKIFGNSFWGVAQATSLNPNVEGAATFFQDGSGGIMVPGHITLPNNAALYSQDSSGTAQPMIFGTPANETSIRSLAAAARVRIQSFGGADIASFWSNGTFQGGVGLWSANGSVATTLTSLGPPGAHTTVQEWFTITDAGGTVRYIPAY